MTKGVLVFARNNSQVDYVKQAYFLAKQVKTILDLPTTVVTDNTKYLASAYPDYEMVFDHVIETVCETPRHTFKSYYDGSCEQTKLEFKNETRTLAYNLSPYHETLILDSDIVLLDDSYLFCFEQTQDFLIYDQAYDLAGFRDYSEFDFVSDTGIKFYWATCVFFRKTTENKIFFDLLQHIQENWGHYNSIFQINRSVYRNDHAFSIAIHIMNGYQEGKFAGSMPGKLFYTTDKDICWQIHNNEILILLEKENHLGEYTACKWKNKTLHVMNKFSLNRCIDEILND